MLACLSVSAVDYLSHKIHLVFIRISPSSQVMKPRTILQL